MSRETDPGFAKAEDFAGDACPGGAPSAAAPSLAVEELFAPLAGAKGAVLAVSGGPDSLALMHLAADWATRRAAPPLYVATVDHGLRPEARQEAETVGLWARQLGLPHRILIWQHDGPKTRIQERARAARYALLAAYAAEVGADHLVTAHHADDQAETILFRLLRGSGIAGLAGMARKTRRGDLMLLRSLLDVPKSALIAVCEARRQPYFRDPSNENTAFARVHLRQLMPLLAKEGLDREALLRLGRRAARVNDALEHQVEALRAGLDANRSARGFSAGIAGLAKVPSELFCRLLAAEIDRLGTGRPLRLERLETTAERLQHALNCKAAWRGSLAGLSIALDGAGKLTIAPEKPRRRGRSEPPMTENSPLPQVPAEGCHDPVTSG